MSPSSGGVNADERLLDAAQCGDVAAARAALDSGADKEYTEDVVRTARCAADSATLRAYAALRAYASHAAAPCAVRTDTTVVGGGEGPLGRGAAAAGARRGHRDTRHSCTLQMRAACRPAGALTRHTPHTVRRIQWLRCRGLHTTAMFVWCSCWWSEARIPRQMTRCAALRPRGAVPSVPFLLARCSMQARWCGGSAQRARALERWRRNGVLTSPLFAAPPGCAALCGCHSAEWRHAASHGCGERSCGVHYAAGGVQREQGGRELRALHCAPSRRRCVRCCRALLSCCS
jgi:hypothetical protein